MGKHFPLSLLTPYLNCSQLWNSVRLRTNMGCVLAYIPSLVGVASVCIGGSRGCCQRMPPPPNRIHFFHFCIRFHRKVYTSKVGVPPTGQHPPNGKSWIRHWYGLLYCERGIREMRIEVTPYNMGTKGTLKWPIRWRPHYNKLHLTEKLTSESNSTEHKLTEKNIQRNIYNIIKCYKVQFIVTKIAKIVNS